MEAESGYPLRLDGHKASVRDGYHRSDGLAVTCKLPEHILALIEIERRRAQEPYDRVITLLEQVKPESLFQSPPLAIVWPTDGLRAVEDDERTG